MSPGLDSCPECGHHVAAVAFFKAGMRIVGHGIRVVGETVAGPAYESGRCGNCGIHLHRARGDRWVPSPENGAQVELRAPDEDDD